MPNGNFISIASNSRLFRDRESTIERITKKIQRISATYFDEQKQRRINDLIKGVKFGNVGGDDGRGNDTGGGVGVCSVSGGSGGDNGRGDGGIVGGDDKRGNGTGGGVGFCSGSGGDNGRGDGGRVGGVGCSGVSFSDVGGGEVLDNCGNDVRVELERVIDSTPGGSAVMGSESRGGDGDEEFDKDDCHVGGQKDGDRNGMRSNSSCISGECGSDEALKVSDSSHIIDGNMVNISSSTHLANLTAPNNIHPPITNEDVTRELERMLFEYRNNEINNRHSDRNFRKVLCREVEKSGAEEVSEMVHLDPSNQPGECKLESEREGEQENDREGEQENDREGEREGETDTAPSLATYVSQTAPSCSKRESAAVPPLSSIISPPPRLRESAAATSLSSIASPSSPSSRKRETAAATSLASNASPSSPSSRKRMWRTRFGSSSHQRVDIDENQTFEGSVVEKVRGADNFTDRQTDRQTDNDQSLSKSILH